MEPNFVHWQFDYTILYHSLECRVKEKNYVQSI